MKLEKKKRRKKKKITLEKITKQCYPSFNTYLKGVNYVLEKIYQIYDTKKSS